MHIEEPILQKCCFCLPLRGGLLAWGYLKLAISSLMLCYMLWSLLQLIAFTYIFEGSNVNVFYDFTPFVIIMLMMIVDVILHVIFVVGGHKKNVKLLKVYYFYSFTLLVLTAVLGVLLIGIIIGSNLGHSERRLTISMNEESFTLFLNLLIQAYVLLLVRSEIVKLDKMGSFKLLNNSAEAERDSYNLKIQNLSKEKAAAIC